MRGTRGTTLLGKARTVVGEAHAVLPAVSRRERELPLRHVVPAVLGLARGADDLRAGEGREREECGKAGRREDKGKGGNRA